MQLPSNRPSIVRFSIRYGSFQVPVPLHQRLSVGGKVILASDILKNEAHYRIETSSSLGAKV